MGNKGCYVINYFLPSNDAGTGKDKNSIFLQDSCHRSVESM